MIRACKVLVIAALPLIIISCSREADEPQAPATEPRINVRSETGRNTPEIEREERTTPEPRSTATPEPTHATDIASTETVPSTETQTTTSAETAPVQDPSPDAPVTAQAASAADTTAPDPLPEFAPVPPQELKPAVIKRQIEALEKLPQKELSTARVSAMQRNLQTITGQMKQDTTIEKDSRNEARDSAVQATLLLHSAQQAASPEEYQQQLRTAREMIDRMEQFASGTNQP